MRFTSTGRPLGLRHGLVAAGAFLFAASLLNGHPVAQGTMLLDISAERIRVELIVSMEEVLVQNALSSSSGQTANSTNDLCRRHAEYLQMHLRLSADGKPLPGRLILATPPSIGNGRPAYQFEYSLPQRPAKVRVEQNILNEFNYAPGNRWEATYVVRVLQSGGLTMEGLLLTSRAPLLIECDWDKRSSKTGSTSLNKWRLVGQYVRHGILHILTGYDHLLFIAGLVLAVVTLWDLIKVVTAFTLAHSITLTVSVLDIFRLPGKVVEPMIAASIVFVAAQNVWWPRRSRGISRLAIAFFFGLFHGLGFAGGLLDAMQGMAGVTIALAIVAFSIGIEIGHQAVVLPIFAVLKGLRRQSPRTGRLAEHIFRYGSVAIVGAGGFYLIAALR